MLCGSSTCGCALVSVPAVTGEINGALPTIDVAGNGTSASPWNLTLNDEWAANVAGAAWVSFTPTWSFLTVGNGTQAARWRYESDNMHIQLAFTLGSTSAVGSSPSLTIPDSKTSSTRASVGAVVVLDGGTYLQGTYIARTALSTSVTFITFTSSSPMVWTTGDRFDLDIVVTFD